MATGSGANSNMSSNEKCEKERKRDIYEIGRNFAEKRLYALHRTVDRGAVGIYAVHDGGWDICSKRRIRDGAYGSKHRYALYDGAVFHINPVRGRYFDSDGNTFRRKKRKKGQ